MSEHPPPQTAQTADARLRELLEWAKHKRDDWDGRSGDRWWQMCRVIVEIENALVRAVPAPPPPPETRDGIVYATHRPSDDTFTVDGAVRLTRPQAERVVRDLLGLLEAVPAPNPDEALCVCGHPADDHGKAEAEAKIVQLTADLQACAHLQDRLIAAEQEIERLRSEWEEAGSMWCEADKKRIAAEQEIQRLKIELRVRTDEQHIELFELANGKAAAEARYEALVSALRALPTIDVAITAGEDEDGNDYYDTVAQVVEGGDFLRVDDVAALLPPRPEEPQ